MAELTDYSGEFEQEFNFDRFNKQTLLKIIRAYSDYMIKVDAFWFLTMMDKWGNDEAVDCDIKQLRDLSKPYEKKAIAGMLNIRGNDVATVMKTIQVSPWGQIWDIRLHDKYRSREYKLTEDEIIDLGKKWEPKTATRAGLGMDELRLLSPGRPGDALTLECEVTSMRPSKSHPSAGVVVLTNTLLNQRGEIMLTYKLIGLLEKRLQQGQ